RGDVRGLTTGASLWLAGAAGLATGMGLYWLAYAVTGMALLVLVVMEGLKMAIAALARHWKRRRDD
ncbi:MAG: MgtC/SapB family protein, partial [Alphaproteobacteria bacterium]|nr:MgtC/SapB family protein [Alphaproteobacteria bacterium]